MGKPFTKPYLYITPHPAYPRSSHSTPSPPPQHHPPSSWHGPSSHPHYSVPFTPSLLTSLPFLSVLSLLHLTPPHPHWHITPLPALATSLLPQSQLNKQDTLIQVLPCPPPKKPLGMMHRIVTNAVPSTDLDCDARVALWLIHPCLRYCAISWVPVCAIVICPSGTFSEELQPSSAALFAWRLKPSRRWGFAPKSNPLSLANTAKKQKKTAGKNWPPSRCSWFQSFVGWQHQDI